MLYKILLLNIISTVGIYAQQVGGTFVFPADWKCYTTNLFSIYYPAESDFFVRGPARASFVIKYPTSSNTLKKGVLTLTIEDVSNKHISSLEQYVWIAQKQIQQHINNCKMIMSRVDTFGKMNYHKFVFTGDQSIYNLTWEQYYTMKNNLLYVLTIAVPSDIFYQYKETGEKIVSTFIIK